MVRSGLSLGGPHKRFHVPLVELVGDKVAAPERAYCAEPEGVQGSSVEARRARRTASDLRGCEPDDRHQRQKKEQKQQCEEPPEPTRAASAKRSRPWPEDDGRTIGLRDDDGRPLHNTAIPARVDGVASVAVIGYARGCSARPAPEVDLIATTGPQTVAVPIAWCDDHLATLAAIGTGIEIGGHHRRPTRVDAQPDLDRPLSLALPLAGRAIPGDRVEAVCAFEARQIVQFLPVHVVGLHRAIAVLAVVEELRGLETGWQQVRLASPQLHDLLSGGRNSHS